MAFDRDELDRRRKAREEARRRRQREVMMLRLLIAVMLLAVAAVGIMLLTGNSDGGGETVSSGPTAGGTQPPTQVQTTPSTAPETNAPTEEETLPPTEAPTKAPTEAPTEKTDSPTTVIHLAAAGDLNINDTTVASGRIGGGYDYTDVFMDVAPVFANADLALLNFEGNLVGEPYGSETVSAPQAMAEAVKAMGVDLVQLANSCSVTHGIKGLTTTLANVREAGLEPLGAFSSAEEFERTKGYTIVNVRGIRIALVAFTKGVGGLSLPAGSEDCVNMLYTDYATTYQHIDKTGITRILSNVATEKPDLTIALVHWGSEYKDMVTGNQKSIAKLMKENGVDVILGTHSHMLHEIEYDPISGQMVAYSLGDFYGAADRAGTNYSIILDLEITRDNASGDTRVTGYTYTPIYTLTEEETSDGSRRVVRLENAMGAYEENFVGKVSESVYNDMTHALERVHARINPKAAEEE